MKILENILKFLIGYEINSLEKSIILGVIGLFCIHSISLVNGDSNPEWLRSNAEWWSEGKIDDITYLNSIEFLINSGIISMNNERYSQKIEISSGEEGIFKIWTWAYDIYFQDGNQVSRNLHYTLIDEYENLYREIGIRDELESVVVVIPVFTSSAYSQNGFYDYFRGECESCYKTKLIHDYNLEFIVASQTGAQILGLLGYPLITDIDVDKNPKILENFDTVIILHNEYVTKKEFDAIINHNNVIFLYPNALHAEISIDYYNEEITLVRGHGFPQSDIINGFDWEYDNTYPYEKDDRCLNWEFYDIPNGKMLNCYPEIKIITDIELLKTIKNLVK